MSEMKTATEVGGIAARVVTMGRPTIYSQDIEDRIIDGLIEGLSLVQICRADDMPSRRTVMRWMESNETFGTRCARARVEQADLMDDKILDVADNCTPETAAADRVKLSAYQWRASKLAPKKYGDRLAHEHAGKDGGPIKTEDASGFELARRIAFALASAKPEGGDNG